MKAIMLLGMWSTPYTILGNAYRTMQATETEMHSHACANGNAEYFLRLNKIMEAGHTEDHS